MEFQIAVSILVALIVGYALGCLSADLTPATGALRGALLSLGGPCASARRFWFETYGAATLRRPFLAVIKTTLSLSWSPACRSSCCANFS